jgi:hypothetical protein
VKNTEEALQALAMFLRGEGPFTNEAARAARITQAGSKVPNLNRAYAGQPLQSWVGPKGVSLPGKVDAMSQFMAGQDRIPLDVHALEGVGSAGKFDEEISALRALMNSAEGRNAARGGNGVNEADIYRRTEGAFQSALQRITGKDYQPRGTFAQYWEGVRGQKDLKYEGGVMDVMRSLGALEPGVMSDPKKLQQLMDSLYEVRDFAKAQKAEKVAARAAAKAKK